MLAYLNNHFFFIYLYLFFLDSFLSSFSSLFIFSTSRDSSLLRLPHPSALEIFVSLLSSLSRFVHYPRGQDVPPVLSSSNSYLRFSSDTLGIIVVIGGGVDVGRTPFLNFLRRTRLRD